MKNKGFTLIELLAVIVILGILISITTISVSSIITNSRKQTFVDSAKNFIQAAKTLASEAPGRFYPPEAPTDPITGKKLYYYSSIIYISDLPINGQAKEESSFGKKYDNAGSFVRIEDSEVGFKFYVSLLDEGGNFLRDVKENELKTDLINNKSTTAFPVATCEHCVVVDTNAPAVSKKCVLLGDINADNLVDDKDYNLCVSIASGNYTINEAEYNVLTNNGIIADGYGAICEYIKNKTSKNGAKYGETKVTIYPAQDGFRKFINTFNCE